MSGGSVAKKRSSVNRRYKASSRLLQLFPNNKRRKLSRSSMMPGVERPTIKLEMDIESDEILTITAADMTAASVKPEWTASDVRRRLMSFSNNLADSNNLPTSNTTVDADNNSAIMPELKVYQAVDGREYFKCWAKAYEDELWNPKGPQPSDPAVRYPGYPDNLQKPIPLYNLKLDEEQNESIKKYLPKTTVEDANKALIAQAAAAAAILADPNASLAEKAQAAFRARRPAAEQASLAFAAPKKQKIKQTEDEKKAKAEAKVARDRAAQQKKQANETKKTEKLARELAAKEPKSATKDKTTSRPKLAPASKIKKKVTSEPPRANEYELDEKDDKPIQIPRRAIHCLKGTPAPKTHKSTPVAKSKAIRRGSESSGNSEVRVMIGDPSAKANKKMT